MNTTANTDAPTFTVTAINRGLGTIEIHKQGCRDLKRNARGASIWDIKAQSQQQVTEDVYGDMIAEDPEQTWEAYTVELDYANCCPSMPYRIEAAPEAATAPEVAAPKAGRTDQASLILTFLEGHRGVNYTPHTLAKAIGHGGLRDALRRLADAGTIDRVGDNPAVYVLRVHPLPTGE